MLVSRESSLCLVSLWFLFFMLSAGMTAIGLSPNRRYVAVAEKSNKPVLIIYDLLHDQSRKRKVIVTHLL